jgi:hypothetical protein
MQQHVNYLLINNFNNGFFLDIFAISLKGENITISTHNQHEKIIIKPEKIDNVKYFHIYIFFN